MFDTPFLPIYHSYRGIDKEDYDFIHNRGIIDMTSAKDSLECLQKLCTTNNIHILISKESSEGSYQIWDECSDDTYEMDNVDDVMKAVECLNELKKWRQ